MRKFTLTIIAAIMAVVAFGQDLSLQATSVSKPLMLDNQIRAWHSTNLPASVKHHQNAARKAAGISNIEDLLKGYKGIQRTIDTKDNSVKETETVWTVVTKGEADNEIILHNYIWGYDINATVNVENGTISIPSQVVFSNNTYGPISLVLVFYYGGDDQYPAGWYFSRKDAIEGSIEEDGSIVIRDYCVLKVDEGEYANYNYSYTFTPVTLNKTNGILTYRNARSETAATEYTIVQITKTSTGVSVENFGNNGKTVNIDMDSNNQTLSIAKQLVWEGGDTYGDFYTYAANYTVSDPQKWADYIAGEVISGTYTDSKLSWGPWIAYAETGYVYITGIDGTIEYTDGSTFGSDANGISVATATQQAASESYVDLSGRKVSANAKGLVIKTVSYADGTKKTVKVVR